MIYISGIRNYHHNHARIAHAPVWPRSSVGKALDDRSNPEVVGSILAEVGDFFFLVLLRVIFHVLTRANALSGKFMGLICLTSPVLLNVYVAHLS